MRSKLAISFAAFVLPLACIDDQDLGNPEEAISTDENEVAPFAEVELEPGHSLAFYADSKSIVITEVTPPGGVTVLKAARATDATSLEVYQAVAPDAAVPRELEAAHPIEAQERGRADTGVHPLAITASPLADDPPCTSETTFEDWFYWDSEYLHTHVADYIQTYNPFGGGPVSYYIGGHLQTTFLSHFHGGCNKDGGNKTFQYCTSDDDILYRCRTGTSVAAGSTWFVAHRSTEPIYAISKVTYGSGVYGTSRMTYEKVL